MARGGVDDVVGADDQAHVGLRHLGVDVVHLDELVVWNVGLGQQHVHVPRHAAGHRVNAKGHVHAALGQRIEHLAYLVLRLCHRHDTYNSAIAKIKDYIAAGRTYQVNYTMRLQANFTGNACRPAS